VDTHIRGYRATDADAVVALSLRTWGPIHDSLRDVMGDAIFQRLFGPDWRDQQRADVEDALTDESMEVWVAEVDGTVAGFAAAIVKAPGGLGEVYMVAVDPPFQNRGVGTRLMNVATDWLRDAGCSIAVVSTGGDPGHAPARATYERAGFTPVPAVNYFKAL